MDKTSVIFGNPIDKKTIKSAANTIGRELGKQLIRGILGNLK